MGQAASGEDNLIRVITQWASRDCRPLSRAILNLYVETEDSSVMAVEQTACSGSTPLKLKSLQDNHTALCYIGTNFSHCGTGFSHNGTIVRDCGTSVNRHEQQNQVFKQPFRPKPGWPQDDYEDQGVTPWEDHVWFRLNFRPNHLASRRAYSYYFNSHWLLMLNPWYWCGLGCVYCRKLVRLWKKSKNVVYQCLCYKHRCSLCRQPFTWLCKQAATHTTL